MVCSEQRRRSVRRHVATLLPVVALVALTACNDDGREMREPTPDQTLSIITTTVPPEGAGGDVGDIGVDESVGADTGDGMGHSDALVSAFDVTLPWPNGDRIPARHTCTGDGVSPAISWDGLPEGTVEVAVVVRTPTAPDPVHWIVAGLPPETTRLREGTPVRRAIVGTNDLGVVGWSPPCPTDASGLLVRVDVYALGQQLEAQSGDPADTMLAAIEAASMASATGTGIATL